MSISALLAVGGTVAAILVVVALLQKLNIRKGRELGSHNKRLSEIGRWSIAGLTALSLSLFAAAYSTNDYHIGAAQTAGTAVPTFSNASSKPANNIKEVYADLRVYAQSKIPNSPIPPRRKSLPGVDTMIARLAKRLESKPEDAEGWRMLGWSYFHTGNYAAAVKAYGRAVTLSPDDAKWQSAYGEALVKAANGSVPPKAVAAFDRAIALDESNLRSRYYRGLTKKSSGEVDEALELWIALAKDVKGNESWLPDLRRHAKTLATDQGADSDELQKLLGLAPVADTKAMPERGPSAEDIANAKRMTPQDRQAMIRNMVDGLAQRLEENPNDSDGWIKLIRSRMVLGESDKAKAALTRALEAFGNDAFEKEKIVTVARELGVRQD